MAKYVANPVEVDAYIITDVGTPDNVGTPVRLEGRDGVYYAYPEQTARMTPQVGDYWVVQSDGYVYLNPKAVFERKYRRL